MEFFLVSIPTISPPSPVFPVLVTFIFLKLRIWRRFCGFLAQRPPSLSSYGNLLGPLKWGCLDLPLRAFFF